MRKHIYISIFFIFLCNGVLLAQNAITLHTNQTTFNAGDAIVLTFKTNSKLNYNLYCTNSYGSTLLKSTTTDDGIAFGFPEHFTKKRGIILWKLFQNKEVVLEGKLNVKPLETSKSLEMYLGPPSIEAGGKDFTMLVAIPTDSLDNPLSENTKVTVKTQFLRDENQSDKTVKNLITYQNIFSPLQSGRMLLSTQHQQKNSTELDVNIVPAIPKNFKIYFDRNHNYADGNQITTPYTSILKDKNNNVISDGTFVYFYITTDENVVLKTFGQTINGVAKAKMIHPDKAVNWKVKAFIEGISESNSININYQQAVQDFKVVFANNNTTIQVGPFKSFMNQMIPDGLQVKLTVSQNNNVIKVYYSETRKGFTNFILNKNFYQKGRYTLKIEAAGLVRNYEKISLW